MNDESKKVYPIGESKKPERHARENPAERPHDSDTNINKALKEITEDKEDPEVEMGKIEVD